MRIAIQIHPWAPLHIHDLCMPHFHSLCMCTFPVFRMLVFAFEACIQHAYIRIGMDVFLFLLKQFRFWKASPFATDPEWSRWLPLGGSVHTDFTCARFLATLVASFG